MRRLLDGGVYYNFIWSEENPTKALSYIATHAIFSDRAFVSATGDKH